MAYKWRPNATQRKAFAERMKDPQEQQAYNQSKIDKANKRREGSNFDYNSAGGNYKPTQYQNEMARTYLFSGLLTSEQKEACNFVTVAYSCNETTHHDNIHIVNELIRSIIS